MSHGERVIVEDVFMPTRDGASLATDVLRLDDSSRRPVLLVRTPYGRTSLRAGVDAVALARSGWVVVLQDVRGRWNSTGVYNPFAQEIEDGKDAVKWCASMAWSSGDVVMGGASYDGLTAWLAARDMPAGLRAIAPIVSAPDTADPWIRRGAALNLGFLLNWAIGLGILGSPGDPEVQAKGTQWHSDFRYTVRRPDAMSLLTTVFPAAQAWFRDPVGESTPVLHADDALVRTGLPIYHVTGWHDIFVEGALTAYRAMLASPARSAQRLVIGPWTHGAVYGTNAGEHEYGTDASGFLRFPAERMEFLRAAAAGEPIAGGASVWVMGSNRWLELPEWPPSAHWTEWFLGEHTLGPITSPPATLSWIHDHDDPVPTRGGRVLHPGTDIAGPVKDDLSGRDDVITFTGDRLEGDLTVAGEVALRINFEADTPEADLTAKLLDVHPDGSAYGVVDGVLRIPQARYGTITFVLGSIAMTFASGHRLRLQLAGSNFPAFDRTPSGRRRVQVGAGSGSVLHLPVITL